MRITDLVPHPHLGDEPQLSRRPLWEGGGTGVSDAGWDRGRHPAERFNDGGRAPAVVLMRYGSYLKRTPSDTGVGDPNHVTLYNARQPVRISHPCGTRTRGTTFLMHPRLVAGLLEDLDADAPATPEQPFRRLSRPVSPSTYLLYQTLTSHLRGPEEKDALFVDETMLEFLRSVLRDATGRTPDRRRAWRGEDRLRGRIPLVQAYLASEYRRAFALEELAARFGCTPWHLSRVFAEEAGIPVFRYLGRVRVRHALEQILEGATTLADVAGDAGFSTHSHFSTAFRREFDLTPRTVRSRAGRERVRRVIEGLATEPPH